MGAGSSILHVRLHLARSRASSGAVMACRILSFKRSSHCFLGLHVVAGHAGQSLFKTSHVTRRPSLKRLSGIQVQLLSLCMGKHQILQNCSLNLRLNFIFEITNEIGQQPCYKCCFFCSNSVIKSLFLRLDQPVRMNGSEHVSKRWLFLKQQGLLTAAAVTHLL